jgi:hypothetical protein
MIGADLRVPKEPSMTAAETEAKTVVTDIRAGAENAFNWLKEVIETHIPAAEADWNAGRAELQRLQSSPLVKAAEDAVLTPAEEEWVAHLISEMPALRVKAVPDASAGGPAGIDAEPDSAAAA